MDLLDQEIVRAVASAGSCKSAPAPDKMTMPAFHHSVFIGQMPILLPTNSVKALKNNSNKTGIHYFFHKEINADDIVE